MRFSEIPGQERAKDSFFAAVHENRLAHALILKGQEGVGKLAFANAIAQYINCEDPTPTDSCGKCGNCHKISRGIHPDVRFVLPIISTKVEGKTPTSDDYFAQFREHFFKQPYFTLNDWTEVLKGENKQLGIFIHEIRELKRKIQLKAFEAKYKVVIFWSAEKINTEAANALLKLLEEPPERTILILTVSDPSQLLSTINSRCQRLPLYRVNEEVISAWLNKNAGISPSQATQIAAISDGSISKALEKVSEAERSLSEMYHNWMRITWKGDYSAIHSWVEKMAGEDREFQKLFLTYSVQKLRDSMLFAFGSEGLALVTEEERTFQQNFSKHIQINGVEDMSRLLEDSLTYIGRNANPSMVFMVLSIRFHHVLQGKVLI